MKYNPRIHHRRSIRLKGYDYASEGLYFITICCQNMTCRFGHIDNKEMILNEFGKIAYDEWLHLPERFANVTLDVFQIMPNHMHGIIILNSAQNSNHPIVGAGASPAPTVGDILGAYKSLVANGCLDICKGRNEMMGKLWQRDYWDHMIRNEQSYKNISYYIINNTAKWKGDRFYKP